MADTEITGVIVCNGGRKVTKAGKDVKKQAKMVKFLQKQQKNQKFQNHAEIKSEKHSKDSSPKQKQIITYAITTKAGDKKDVCCDLPLSYSPTYVEACWYDWWEKEGFFRPEYGGKDLSSIKDSDKFVMVIPPPNVTGTLHLGHALTNSIQDAIARWHRMNGKTVLWVPGCDHAGIATQVVVEKKLWRELGMTRHDLGRDAFLEEVWKWKEEKGDYIYKQLKALGSSLDWSRACFTMDEKMRRAVGEAFVRLFDDGSIYRSFRLVNWSCALRSAISDIEVDKVELTGRTLIKVPGYDKPVEFGVLTYFSYPVIGADNEFVTVATTRLETMLGDTGIAVHPNDTRYKHLVGRKCKHPFTGRELLIVADSFVDAAFGTGAVKITPAHDHNDYEVGRRHDLPFVTCISDDGFMNGNCGEFAGLKRFEAREVLAKALRNLKLFKCTESHSMVVPVCNRTKDIIEPMLKAQWYVKCTEMANKAIDAVATGQLRIMPEAQVKVWNNWMENIRDWCISRQLWWGHRIPAYFISVEGEPKADDSLNDNWVAALSEEEAMAKACEKMHLPPEKVHLRQDTDVLDTWFSSALFPFSVFGWPDQTDDLKRFYPGRLLETGYDILFFWVARMVFFGQKLTGKLPFKEVYLHSVVRDAHGRKMSKSLGNVIDPLDVIRGISLQALIHQLGMGNLDVQEIDRAKTGLQNDYPDGIPECGTDALRFALCAYTGQGRDVNLDVLRVQGYRHFCNKIWNAVKFTLTTLGNDFVPVDHFELNGLERIVDVWILSRLSVCVKAANDGFSQYEFSNVTSACFNFWLYEFCDVYLESVKPVLQGGDYPLAERCRQILYLVVEAALRLISPFMPFITEELWQRLPVSSSSARCRAASICVAAYPTSKQYCWTNPDAERQLTLAMSIVKATRNVRADYNLTPRVRTKLYVTPLEEGVADEIRPCSELITTLSSSSSTEVYGYVPEGCATYPIGSKCKVHIFLKGLIDVEQEVGKLSGKKKRLVSQLSGLQTIMAHEDYETKVPEKVRSINETKKTEIQGELVHIEESIAALNSMVM